MPFEKTLENAWRSDRLVYRAMEEDAQDKAYVFTLNDGEPSGMAMVSPRLLAPGDRPTAEAIYKWGQDAVLCVFICLPLQPGDALSRPKPIGILTLTRRGQTGPQHRNAMLCITIGKEYRRQGYGTEAINWALDWAFLRANLHRVGLTVFGYNPGAKTLYEKLGFVQEGRERDALWFERKWYDLFTMGILEAEWEALRKGNRVKWYKKG
ncbi:hypothetical protein OQA88_11303 [Cercophora sp. LCS_1]